MTDRSDDGSTWGWRRQRREFAARLPLPCSVCGLPVQPGEPWEMDHVIPRSKGGTELWPAHKACNRTKHARILTTRPYRDPHMPW